jgi:hypothetical protein
VGVCGLPNKILKNLKNLKKNPHIAFFPKDGVDKKMLGLGKGEV